MTVNVIANQQTLTHAGSRVPDHSLGKLVNAKQALNLTPDFCMQKVWQSSPDHRGIAIAVLCEDGEKLDM
jgi:hypothetical protein